MGRPIGPRRGTLPSTSTVLDRVTATISRYNMLAPGERVGVAVSGGADSVFLLRALHALAGRWNLTLTAVHLNHRLRGKESDADERFVRELAASVSVPLVCEAADVRSRPGNLEEAGRQARRALFARLVADGTVTKIATGHTRSDQAETVLYRILRGAATTGLRGILPVTSEGLIRPLLDCERHEIEVWLNARGYHWREDRTNRDQHFVRNRIRHCLLPQLEREYNHSLRSILSHLAQVTQDEETYWSQEVSRLAPVWFVRERGSVMLQAARVDSAPAALARRLLRAAIEEVKGNLHRIDFTHVEALRLLCSRSAGHGRVDLPGVTVERSFDWVRFVAGAPEPNWLRFVIDAVVPGRTELPGDSALKTEVVEFSKRYNEANTDCVDAALVSERLRVRAWKPGDRIESDAGRLRKLKDLFQHARIPLWDRQGWPVITDGETIIWTPRFGPSAHCRPREQTKRVIRFFLENTRGESNPGGLASNHLETLRL